MAFPSVLNTDFYFGTSNTSNHSVPMPGTVNAGDLLVVTAVSSQDVNTPSGWVRPGAARTFYKIAAGNEDGTNQTFTLTSSGQMFAAIFRVPAGEFNPNNPIENAAASSNQNPPSLTPTWLQKETTWVAVSFIQVSGSASLNGLTGAPANYSQVDWDTRTGGGATPHYGMAIAVRKLAATTEDPGTFSWDASTTPQGMLAWTIAIQPATPTPGVDAVSEANDTTGSSNPIVWEHEPEDDPSGVIVFIVQSGSALDQVSGVTYGEVPMVRIATAADTATEPGRSYAYFLGSNIPTGPQDVEITKGGTIGMWACAMSIVSSEPYTTVVDFDIAQENRANPAVSLDTGEGQDTVLAAAVFSGVADPASITPGSGMFAAADHDFGSAAAKSIYGYGDGGTETVGFTIGTDDVAMVAVAIAGASALPVEVTPSTVALATSFFAPTVTVTQHRKVTPTLLTLETAPFAPTILLSDHKTVMPALLELETATFAPTILLPKLVTPALLELAIALNDAVVETTQGLTVIPTTLTLETATFAPEIELSDNKLLVPPTLELGLTEFAPTVALSDHKRVVPGLLELATAFFAPSVIRTNHIRVRPATLALLLELLTPEVVRSLLDRAGPRRPGVGRFAPVNVGSGVVESAKNGLVVFRRPPPGVGR